MDRKLHLQLSKFLSYTLRHNPDELQLTMDPRGYVKIDEYIEHFNSQPKPYTFLTRDILLEIVKEDTQRYGISEDGLSIRANYGHSIPYVNPDLEFVQPPDVLLHGTSLRALASIMSTGIKKMSRNAVHLTDIIEEARRVGQRHCHKGESPTVLKVDAKRMKADGVQFLKSSNGKILVEYVDPKYITVLE